VSLCSFFEPDVQTECSICGTELRRCGRSRNLFHAAGAKAAESAKAGLKRFSFDLVHQINSKAQHPCWFQSWFAANVMCIGCKPL
jgi:hypothetical protein